MLLRPGAGIVALVIILGVFLVISGMLGLAGAVTTTFPGSPPCSDWSNVTLGIVILALPDIGLITLALLFGVSLVVRGAVAIASGTGCATWTTPNAGPPLRRPAPVRGGHRG